MNLEKLPFSVKQSLVEQKPELAIEGLLQELTSQKNLSESDDRNLRIIAAEVLVEIKRYQEALYLLNPILPPQRQEFAFLKSLVEALLGCDDSDAAFSWIQAIADSNIDASPQLFLELLIRWSITVERPDLAREYLEKLADLNPSSLEKVFLEADLFSAEAEKLKAIQLLQEALSIHSSSRRLHLRLADAYCDAIQLDQARAVLHQASGQFGCDGRVRAALIEMATQEPHLTEALALLDEQDQQSRDFLFYHRRGAIRFYQKDLDQAECDFRKALAFGLNGTLESLFMLSELLRMKGDFAQSMRLLEARYRLEPDVASLGFALAYDHLAAGEWQQGWPLYENRLKLKQTIFPLGLFPNWQGESLHGKRVLVLSEQGLGDAVMASSQLHKLAAIAADWTVMCFPQLQPLLAQTFGAKHCVSEMDQSEIDLFDVQVGLCSLPYAFSFSGDSDAPESFLSIRPEDVSLWKARLAKYGKKKVIGFTWFGGGNALNKQRRSMQLNDLLPLFSSDPSILWVSMQYGGEDIDAELIEFASRHQLQLPSFRELCFEPYQQAALLLALDLTISVQQTLVHLAGSVGANLWAMLPTAPEWRYGNTGSHMPWYSSVSLYRQTKPFDWETVIDSVATDLQTYFA